MHDIYYIKTDHAPFTDADRRMMEIVSEERRKKVMRFRFASDRKLSLYAALSVRFGLCRSLGLKNSSLSFYTDSSGKPFFMNSTGAGISLSHTEGMAVCAVSLSGVCGIDAEIIKDPPFEVMPMIFSHEEIAYTDPGRSPVCAGCRIKDDNAATRFFTVWTRKEAFAKCTGTGLTDDLKDADLVGGADAQRFTTIQNGEHIFSFCPERPGRITFTQVTASDLADFFIR